MAIIYEKKEFILSFKEDKPKVYRIAPVKQQKVVFDKLLDEVSNSCGVNRAQVKASVEGMLDRMMLFMDYGMSVNLGDFGTFKPTINVKAQKDAADLGAENVVRKKILFIPGKRFRNMLTNLSVTSKGDSDSDAKGNSSSGNENGGNGGGGTVIDPDA